jgi:hypothetical protein
MQSFVKPWRRENSAQRRSRNFQNLDIPMYAFVSEKPHRLAGLNFGLAIGVVDSLSGGAAVILQNLDILMYDCVSEKPLALCWTKFWFSHRCHEKSV